MPCKKDAHNAPDQQPYLLKRAYGTGTEVQAQSQIPTQQLKITHQTEGERGGRGVQKLQLQKYQGEKTKKNERSKGCKNKKIENHTLRPEEKDWEPEQHDVTTSSAKQK